MKKLLTREQVFLINEKAVDWDKSLLGVLTKGVLSPLSWLAGSIKKGVKLKQINNLVMQWGLEYIKALKSIDTGEPITDVVNDDIKIEIGKEYEYKNDKDELKIVKAISLTNAIKTEPDKEFLTGDDIVGETIADGNVFIAFQNKDGKYLGANTTMAVPITKLSTISNKNDNKQTNINKLEDLKILNKELSELKKIKDSINNMLNWKSIDKENRFNEFKKIISQNFTYTDTTILKLTEFIKHNDISAFNKYFDSINKFIDDMINSKNTNDVSQKLNISKDSNDFPRFKEKFDKIINDKVNELDKIINIYTLGIEYLNTLKDNNIKESLINEAKEYKLPKNITELLPQAELDKLKEIENIKVDASKKVNIKALDAIKYEAEYIINKAKENKDKNVLEMQKTWDLGIKQLNDYFQDIIDVDNIYKRVKSQADNDVKLRLQETEESIENLQKMGITETFAVGQKFNINKLYALDCNLIGQNNKNIKVVLLLSPTSEFVEDIDGIKYFWFKLLGGYKWDKKTNTTVRENIFTKTTSNKKIINNFEKIESSYYIALRNLRPGATYSYMYIYSNYGKFFFNNKIVNNTSDIENDLKEYKKDKFDATLKSIFNVANLFKIKINQRFIVDDENIKAKKYPGIQIADLKIDKGFDIAQQNHNKLIELLQ